MRHGPTTRLLRPGLALLFLATAVACGRSPPAAEPSSTKLARIELLRGRVARLEREHRLSELKGIETLGECADPPPRTSEALRALHCRFLPALADAHGAWEGVFRPDPDDGGLVLVARMRDGELWVATDPDRADRDRPIPAVPSDPELRNLIAEVQEARGKGAGSLVWWSRDDFRKEFAADLPADSIWEDTARISRLWTEALATAGRELPDEQAPRIPVPLLVRDNPGGTSGKMVVVGYYQSLGEVVAHPRELRLFSLFTGADLTGDERLLSLVLVHEAVHVYDENSLADLRRARYGRGLRRREIARGIEEGHADLVASRVAAARGLSPLWDRFVRARCRFMLAFPESLEVPLDIGTPPRHLTSFLDLYDLGWHPDLLPRDPRPK